MGKSAVLSFATKQQIQVKGLTFRSQDVQPGYIFFALKGANVDGNAFIAQAAERGAALIVSAQQPAVLPPVPFYLSPDIDTAYKVGRRKEHDPVILKIDAARANEDGVVFYVGNDITWLADQVPPQYISVLKKHEVLP
jgi:UDP-N-acetylmuramyl pentapeptide synthase